MLGYPACVYGFFMYIVIASTACAGLLAGRRSRRAGERTATSIEAHA
jgi:hypothetical protein